MELTKIFTIEFQVSGVIRMDITLSFVIYYPTVLPIRHPSYYSPYASELDYYNRRPVFDFQYHYPPSVHKRNSCGSRDKIHHEVQDPSLVGAPYQR